MTNKCAKELVDLLMYSRFTPTCSGKCLPSSGGRRCLRSCSSSVCNLGVYGLRFHDNWPQWTDRNPYTPTIHTLLEHVLRHLRSSKDGNHLPKHVGVNLEYVNKSTSCLKHLLVILRYYKMRGQTIKIYCVSLSCRLLKILLCCVFSLCSSLFVCLFVCCLKSSTYSL
jgi:hypothetical protein